MTTRRLDGKPETDADRRFFDLRESGYKGPVDQGGHAVESMTPGVTRYTVICQVDGSNVAVLAVLDGEHVVGGSWGAPGRRFATTVDATSGVAARRAVVEAARVLGGVPQQFVAGDPPEWQVVLAGDSWTVLALHEPEEVRFLCAVRGVVEVSEWWDGPMSLVRVHRVEAETWYAAYRVVADNFEAALDEEG